MTIALVMLFSTVGARVATLRLLVRARDRIAAANQGKAEVLQTLSKLQKERAVASQNRTVMERKRTRLSKKLERLREQLQEMEATTDRRREQADAARGRLVR